MKKFLAVVAVAATMSTGAVFAQTMDEGLSMLELAASREFTKLGIDVDPMSLSLNQLAQVRSVLGSSDYNVNEQKRQIERIVAVD